MFSFRRPLWWLSLSPLVRLPRLRHALLMLRKLEASRACDRSPESKSRHKLETRFCLAWARESQRKGKAGEMLEKWRKEGKTTPRGDGVSTDRERRDCEATSVTNLRRAS